MEILDENFFNALTSKIKKVFGSQNDESKSTPEQELYEETVSAIKNVLFEIVTYLSKHHNKELEPGDTFDKMTAVSELIRNILQSIKHYKITTKNPKDTKLTRSLYTNIIEPLHKIQKDTPIVDFEKMLISQAKYILKIANETQLTKHSGADDDAMIDAHEYLFNLYKVYPNLKYTEMKKMMKQDQNDRARAILELDNVFKKNTRAEFDKLQHDNKNEWQLESEYESFFHNKEVQKIKEFDHIWDTSFKQQWIEDYKKEAEQQRSKLAHLKESVNKTIKYIFIKG